MTIIYSGGHPRQLLDLNERMIDVNASREPKAKVEVEITEDGKFWVNFQGVCVLRIQGLNVENIKLPKPILAGISDRK